MSCANYNEAFDLFTRMLSSGMQPDDATLVVTLSACLANGALDFRIQILSCTKDVYTFVSIPIYSIAFTNSKIIIEFDFFDDI